MADITHLVLKDLIVYVKGYALENYALGWDRVYECYDDEDILEAAGTIGKDWNTFQDVIEKIAEIEDDYEAYASEIRSTAF